MDAAIFSAFAKELEKVAGPGASAAFRALDRAGQMAGSGAGLAARSGPRIGTFGVRTVSGISKAAVDEVGVRDADLVTSHEDDRTPDVRRRTKKAAEKLDRESWKQTLKDAPIVVAGTGLGYGLGKTLSEQAGKRVGTLKQKPAWVKHAPLAASVASSLASYSFGKSREAMRRRREEARDRGKK